MSVKKTLRKWMLRYRRQIFASYKIRCLKSKDKKTTTKIVV